MIDFQRFDTPTDKTPFYATDKINEKIVNNRLIDSSSFEKKKILINTGVMMLRDTQIFKT